MKDNMGGDDRPPEFQWVRYSVTGGKGAVNLTFMPDPLSRMGGMGLCGSVDGWMAADFGVHSPKPQYSDHDPMETCELLGEIPCFYDGSTLRAEPYVKLHVAGDEAAIFEILEAEYLDVFG